MVASYIYNLYIYYIYIFCFHFQIFGLSPRYCENSGIAGSVIHYDYNYSYYPAYLHTLCIAVYIGNLIPSNERNYCIICVEFPNSEYSSFYKRICNNALQSRKLQMSVCLCGSHDSPPLGKMSVCLCGSHDSPPLGKMSVCLCGSHDSPPLGK